MQILIDKGEKKNVTENNFQNPVPAVGENMLMPTKI